MHATMPLRNSPRLIALHDFDCPLGADVFGNFTRMGNAIEKLQDQLAETKKALRETHRQLDNAHKKLDAHLQERRS